MTYYNLSNHRRLSIWQEEHRELNCTFENERDTFKDGKEYVIQIVASNGDVFKCLWDELVLSD